MYVACIIHGSEMAAAAAMSPARSGSSPDRKCNSLGVNTGGPTFVTVVRWRYRVGRWRTRMRLSVVNFRLIRDV
jgi:hypothetical protein